jgi:O-antigen/teichoic acid export membrane protein
LGRLKEAAVHTAVYGLGSVMQTALGLVLIPLYTRYYTTDMYGVLTIVMLVGTLAGALFFFGGSSALARSYYDYDAPTSRRVAVGTALWITLAGAVLQVVIGSMAARPLSVALFRTPDYAPHIALALASSACTFVNALFLLILRFERRSTLVVILNVASLVVTTALILWLLVGLQLGVMAPILGGLMSQMALMAALMWACRAQLTLLASRREFDLQLRFGLVAVAIGLTYYVLDSVDRLFIVRYCSLSDVGVYSLGYKIGMIIHVIFILPFSQVWAPMRMQYRDDPTSGELYKTVLTYYWIIGLLATCGVSIFARELLMVVAGRPDYLPAYRVVPLVMLAHLFYGVINVIDFGIILTRKVSYQIYIFAGGVALNVGLNFALVPRFGYMAAAYTTLASYVAVAAVVYLVANRLHPLPIDARRLGIVMASGIGVMAAAAPLALLAEAPAIAVKALLLACLVTFWSFYVLTARERFRLHPAQLLRAH